MVEPHPSKADYGNWVSSRLLYVTGALAVLSGVLCTISAWFILPGVVFLVCFSYLAYAKREFSPAGGDIQSKIQALVLQHLQWNGVGNVLDIGCGNGPLSIAIAKKYPTAQVRGIDFWGRSWEYSKSLCERNAAIERVSWEPRPLWNTTTLLADSVLLVTMTL
jgi:SAM-dependent methyltransferase